MRIIAIIAAGLLISASALGQQQTREPRPQVMTLSTSAWQDGGVIPDRNSQPGGDVSPDLMWSAAPEGTETFVLMVRDLESVSNTGGVHFLHWLVWNIPKSVRTLAENQPEDAELADGTRQISSSGPYYRGPAAPASGPPHHYVFELYALSTTLDVAAVGQTPLNTLAAVQDAMAGKILGKGVLVGLFKRN